MAAEFNIPISEFKAKCLRLLEDLPHRKGPIVVTKRGRAIARVEAVGGQPVPLRGSWEGLVDGEKDIVHFDTSKDWELAR